MREAWIGERLEGGREEVHECCSDEDSRTEVPCEEEEVRGHGEVLDSFDDDGK